MSTASTVTAARPAPAPDTVDVLVIGAGPVGTMAGLLLARAGHSVLVVERKDAAYALPRAVAHDAEIARVLQHAGLPPDEIADAVEPYDDLYVWENGRGETLHQVDWRGIDPSGWNNTYFYHQPALEAHLDAALRRQPQARVRRGVAATVTGQDDHGADVVLTTLASAEETAVRARWVVAADGAGSATRTGLGIRWEDLGYFHDWLVVDVVPRGGLEVTHLAKQVCDPVRPTTVVPGGPGRRRWEFMRLEGESAEELARPERVWQLLEPFGVRPDTAVLERGVVYTFTSGWAADWRRGRVLLVGDAAHQMPPFAGQGLAAGFRDCLNLTWKLDGVLRGVADDQLLDTYTSERAVHVADFIDFSMSLGRIICITDPVQAQRRDEEMTEDLASGRVPEPPPAPRLGPGVHTGEGGGYLSWQGRITTPAHPEPVRYDDAFGPGALVLAEAGLAAEVTAEQVRALAARGVRITTFDPAAATGAQDGSAAVAASFADVHGTYAAWLGQVGARAVLVRPDFYVYGAATSADEVSGLVTGFLAALGGAAPASAAPAVPEPVGAR